MINKEATLIGKLSHRVYGGAMDWYTLVAFDLDNKAKDKIIVRLKHPTVLYKTATYAMRGTFEDSIQGHIFDVDALERIYK